MGRPKAEIEWRGLRFVEHCVSVLRTACTPIVVITGAHPVAEIVGTEAVHNPDWADGQFSSLRVGLRSLGFAGGTNAALPTAVLVHTVDRPHVLASTVDALHDRVLEDETRIWQPQHEGRSGHPIVFPHDVAAAMAEAVSGLTARSFVRANPARRGAVDVHDPAVLENLDRPEDLGRLPVT
jgi:CTP:molybdopterin cytidylyltransferase MocA